MTNTGSKDLERATEIAVDAYAGQTDKAGATYIRHPLRVMETETERVVAVLHDVVEVSEYTLADIEAEFDEEICDGVDALTKRDWEAYLEEFIPRAAANDIARSVKRADIEDNMDLARLDEVTDEALTQDSKTAVSIQRVAGRAVQHTEDVVSTTPSFLSRLSL